MEFSTLDEERINNILINRFYDSVSIYQLLNWLNNFDQEDLPEALKVLENIEYLPIGKMLKIYSQGLSSIFEKFKNKNVILLGIGKHGKSGTAMQYFVNKAPTYNDKRYKRKKHLVSRKEELISLIDEFKILKDDFLLVLLDDFVGTGNSTLEYLEGDEYEMGLLEFLKEHKFTPNISLLSIIINEVGHQRLKYSFPEISLFGEIRKKSFSQPSVFGYRPNTLPIREFCYKYGKRLVGNPINILGYENSQSLIVFEHTTPNNTLPIIWSNKDDWSPLFPRFYTDIVKNFNEFKKEIFYWISISKSKFNIPGLDLSSTPFSTQNVEFFSVLKLLRAKRSEYVVCQWLNITKLKFDEILKDLISLKLCSSNRKLTKNGVKIINEIEQYVFLKKKKNKMDVSQSKNKIVYLPKTFGVMTS